MKQASLSDLRDIALPDAPELWPFAPGLWIALALLALVIAAVIYMLRERRKQNAYRRAGLLLLKNANTNYEVSVVLKRVALAVFPREEVAALHGDAWATFLNETGPLKFEAQTFVSSEQSASTELKSNAAQWIRSHQTEGRTSC